MKVNKLTLLVSILAIVLSVIAISTSLPRTEMSFDYLGFITGSLGFLVTVLLGWNIYTIFDFRQERQDLKTYCDEEKQEWHMLMPDELREALSNDYRFYLDLAEKGQKGPTAKQLRMMAAMKRIMGE